MNANAFWLLAALAMLGLPSQSVLAQGAVPRVVALADSDGAFGPGLGAGVLFAEFGSADWPEATPALNRAGDSVFVARLIGPGINAANDTGIWVERSGILTMLARTGDPAPGTAAGITFSSFYRQPIIGATGKVAFQAVVAGPGVTNDNNEGMWTEGSGSLGLLLRERTTPVPNGAAGDFGDANQVGNPGPSLWFGLPTINEDGRVLFGVRLTSPAGSYGLYSDRTGTLDEVVRRDTVVPGLAPRTFGTIATSPGFSDSGAFVFYGVTTTPFPQFRGYWSDGSGSLQPSTLSGDSAPGTATTFSTILGLLPAINSADQVAFRGELDGTGNWGVWSEGLFGVLQLIAIEGTVAPGTTDTFFSFDDPVLGNSGKTAFVATVTQPTANRGVWSNRAGFLDLVARSGAPVPGVMGATFDEFSALAVNATGEVAFFSTTSTGLALCSQDSMGTLTTIASDFTLLDVFGDGSDLRLIIDMVLPMPFFANEPRAASTGDGRRIAFNDDGDTVFRLKFSDGSEGVFTTAELNGATGTSFCSGDGGNQMGCTNCPCGNNALAGTVGGCLNSANTSSRLMASGSTSVSLPPSITTDLRLALSGVPPNAFCILNSGDAVAPGNPANPCFGMNSGAQAIVFDGLRCAITNTRRHGGRSADVSGDVGVTNNPWGGEGGPPIGLAQAFGGFMAGQTRYFQSINRDDPLAICMRGLNTSQAIKIDFIP